MIMVSEGTWKTVCEAVAETARHLSGHEFEPLPSDAADKVRDAWRQIINLDARRVREVGRADARPEE